MNLKEFLKSKQFLINISLVFLLFIVLTYLTLTLLKVYTHHGKSLTVPDFYGMTINQTEITSNKYKLRYQVIDSMYIPDFEPGTIITQHPMANSKVKQRRTIYLTVASVSPERVSVPSIINVSLREAQSRLEGVGLKLGNVIYRPSEYRNLVLGSRFNGNTIPPDTLLSKGASIDLIVGKGLSDEKIEIPNLFGLNIDEARDKLYNSSLNLGVLIYDTNVSTPTDMLNARVWKQSPRYAPNVMVEMGISVDLWLTNDEEKLLIPDSTIEQENIGEFHFDDTDF